MLIVVNEVLDHVRFAKKKHGDRSMAGMKRTIPKTRLILQNLMAIGRWARTDMEENEDLCRVNILAEEIGELAEALLNGDREHARHELGQVTACCLMWLDNPAEESA